MTTHYVSDSRGAIEIASMHFSHLQNAYDKLVRTRIGNERQGEVDAMRARLDELAAEEAKTGADQ